jgi:lipoate---protein ligase
VLNQSIAYLDLTLESLALNLALDELLLLEAEEGKSGEMLRIWEWPHEAVVLGSGCRFTAEVDLAACAADRVPILRRASGGGTVLLGPGSLCYSLVLLIQDRPALCGIRSSYAYILERICGQINRTGPISQGGLEPGESNRETGLVPFICQAGISDLCVGERKFSGSAQQRKRRFLLHHGTVLYSFDIGRIEKYLPMPERQPDYRGERSHTDFLTNLPVDRDAIVNCLRTVWHATSTAPVIDDEGLRTLAESKYLREEWTRRR